MPKAHNKFDLPGLYKLNCSNFSKFYIGQTGRSFKQRYIEHTKPLHTATESKFANHLIEANHTYKNIDNNMNILHVHTKGRKLDTLEPVSYTHLDVYKRQKQDTKSLTKLLTKQNTHYQNKHTKHKTNSIYLVFTK